MSFFSKVNNNYTFRICIAIFVVAELLSWLSFNFIALNIIILSVVALMSILLVLRNPIYALYIPVVELFWGSLGHSFYFDFWNTRLVIFIAVIFAFALSNFFNVRKFHIKKDLKVLLIWLALILLILSAGAIAYFDKRNTANIFFDGNAYFYLLYLPIWYQVYKRRYLKNVIAILRAAALIVAIKTLVVFNLFSQGYQILDLEFIYKWIRDTRTGEITPFSNNFSRVFMQSQIYLLAAWFFAFIRQLKEYKNWSNFFYLSILAAALLVSLSRSFWLGGIVAFIFLLINIIIFQRRNLSALVYLTILGVAITGWLTVQVFFNLPKWNSFNITEQRTTDTSEAAANSRMTLLPVMWQAIQEKPIMGHGLAKELTYRSSDPRIKNQDNPEGWHTTYAFEWGWLDQWMKMGLFFISILFAWVLLIYARSYRILAQDPVLGLSTLAIMTGLGIIHIFTPYLNHPLGLGLLMLMTITISKNERQGFSYR
jgi:O-antigen ligase